MHCKKFKGTTRAFSEGQELVHRLRCKQWDCDYCAPINARIWQAKLLKSVITIVEENPEQAFSFLTITLPSEIHRMNEGIEKELSQVALIRDNWDMLMKRLKRQYGNFEYVRVLENHKSGVLHIHMLTTAIIEDSGLACHVSGKGEYHHSDVLQAHLTDCGFGYIHDARNLEKVGNSNKESGITVASYIAKYIGKSLGAMEFVHRNARLRKIQTSRKFMQGTTESFESDLQWYFNPDGVSLDEFLRKTKNGIKMVDTVEGEITGDDFDYETEKYKPSE